MPGLYISLNLQLKHFLTYDTSTGLSSILLIKSRLPTCYRNTLVIVRLILHRVGVRGSFSESNKGSNLGSNLGVKNLGSKTCFEEGCMGLVQISRSGLGSKVTLWAAIGVM